MKAGFVAAITVAVVFMCSAPHARAGCVISPDGKAISVVTDNGADAEKNCAVKCQVDTKIGVAQVSCGGNTPPFAKAHPLCDFDKPEPYYKKVLSSEDSCKATPGNAGTPPQAAPDKAAAGKPKAIFSCRISDDGKTADAVIVNPYPQDASCQVNCQLSTTRAGTTFQFSCTKTAAAGAGEVVLCSQAFDKGKLVKAVGGNGQCTNPAVPAADSAKEDDDDDDKEGEKIRKLSEDLLKAMKKK